MFKIDQFSCVPKKNRLQKPSWFSQLCVKFGFVVSQKYEDHPTLTLTQCKYPIKL
jgi:hypothetical protein